MKRGQAFDTFKLMIAAVIAVAILGILLGILGTISVPGAGFDDTVKSLLQRSYSTPGVTTASTGDVTFTQGSVYPGSAFSQYTDGTTPAKFKCSSTAFCTQPTADPDPTVSATVLGDTLEIKSNFKSKIYVVCNRDEEVCCVGVGITIPVTDCIM
jgi:hypothetical protein